jgi:hypothetical protein
MPNGASWASAWSLPNPHVVRHPAHTMTHSSTAKPCTVLVQGLAVDECWGDNGRAGASPGLKGERVDCIEQIW